MPRSQRKPRTPSRRRDEFPKAVQRQLSERVNGWCCRPVCGRLAVGPSAAPVGATRVGQACHITAASPRGPRYDPLLTPAERRSYENGIWLCNVCARLIDVEVDAYPASLLRSWKAETEARVRSYIGERLPRHEDAIHQVTMALTAAPERLIPGAIGNLIRGSRSRLRMRTARRRMTSKQASQ
jgi:hypothetical protein